MLVTFPTQFLDGHIVASINGLDYLVDTGSPISFGQGKTIRIGSEQFPIPASMCGVSPEVINSLSGLHVHGLIGMDILRHFHIQFTLTETSFSDTPLSYSSAAIHLPIIGNMMTVPMVHLKIAGEQHRCYFDTGAQLSYLSEDLLQAYPSIGQKDDFHPSVGKFTTDIHQVEVHLQQNAETLTFGCLPAALRGLLLVGQAKGVLGTELLLKYTIALCNLNGTLIFEPTTNEGDVSNE